MATYDKPKRKNTPSPMPIIKTMLSFIRSMVYYGLVVPIQWMWRQFGRFFGWVWRQIGSILTWTWRITCTILRKTIFAPFIAVGSLLGFVPNAIPSSLSPQEAEIYQRINRQYRRQKRWYLHVISFLIGMVLMWGTEFSNWYQPRIGMLITFTLVWMVVLGMHRLWMNLGESEDHEIGEALRQLRDSQQAVYYEEEIYADQPYDTSHLEDRAYNNAEWTDEEWIRQSAKAKQQHN